MHSGHAPFTLSCAVTNNYVTFPPFSHVCLSAPHAYHPQAQEDAPTRIDGTIEGLTPGSHGIHIHTFGDFSDVRLPPLSSQTALAWLTLRVCRSGRVEKRARRMLISARPRAPGPDLRRRHLQSVWEEPRCAGR